MEALVLGRLLLVDAARDGEAVAIEVDLDILLFRAGELGTDGVRLVVLADIARRLPGRHRAFRQVTAPLAGAHHRPHAGLCEAVLEAMRGNQEYRKSRQTLTRYGEER